MVHERTMFRPIVASAGAAKALAHDGGAAPWRFEANGNDRKLARPGHGLESCNKMFPETLTPDQASGKPLGRLDDSGMRRARDVTRSIVLAHRL